MPWSVRAVQVKPPPARQQEATPVAAIAGSVADLPEQNARRVPLNGAPALGCLGTRGRQRSLCIGNSDVPRHRATLSVVHDSCSGAARENRSQGGKRLEGERQARLSGRDLE